MPMKNPPHPGRSIRSACLEPLGLSVTEGAEVLGVTRQTLSNVVNGKSGISPRWRSGSRRRLAARRKRGYACSLPMISHRREKTRAKSRFAVSMCSRNYTRRDGGVERRRRLGRPLLEKREKWRTPSYFGQY